MHQNDVTDVFIANFGHISHLFLVSILDFEQVNVSYVHNNGINIFKYRFC